MIADQLELQQQKDEQMAELDAALDALSACELRAFVEWRQSTSTDAELDGAFSPQVELGLLAAWHTEVAARDAQLALTAALSAIAATARCRSAGCTQCGKDQRRTQRGCIDASIVFPLYFLTG